MVLLSLRRFQFVITYMSLFTVCILFALTFVIVSLAGTDASNWQIAAYSAYISIIGALALMLSLFWMLMYFDYKKRPDEAFPDLDKSAWSRVLFFLGPAGMVRYYAFIVQRSNRFYGLTCLKRFKVFRSI